MYGGTDPAVYTAGMKIRQREILIVRNARKKSDGRLLTRACSLDVYVVVVSVSSVRRRNGPNSSGLTGTFKDSLCTLLFLTVGMS